MKTIVKILAVLLVVLAFASCRPSYMTVSSRPTAPYYERPLSPGPGYIWLDGDWYWRGNQYRYRPGYWKVPPPHRTWSPGYWQKHGSGWHWRGGQWHR